MQDAVQGLEPEAIFRHFSRFSDIPRKSRHEQAVLDYVREVADARGLAHETDEYGNLLVRKPATPGYEDAPAVVLQGHVDMVCQANKGTEHDFLKDPIRLVRDGDWLKAAGTTLGADNGIGCCAAMALMEADDVEHPALEMLFTVEEEIGLNGAARLGFELAGRVMLNLDTEEDGELYVGCAGGRDTQARVPVSREPVPADHALFRLEVRGLRGGHSGCDIHEQRGNALKLAARAVAALERDLGARLVSLDGGTAHNAIPREAEAVLAVPADKKARVRPRVEKKIAAGFAHELRAVDGGVEVVAEAATEAPFGVLTAESQRRLIDLILAVPHGVHAFSHAVPGLVDTSTNLAIATTGEDHVHFHTSQRASSKGGMEDISGAVAAAFRLAGAEPEADEGYPGWEPDMDSKALAVLKETMKDVLGIDPAVKAIHAGLECGVIRERYPELDTVSFGPTIINAHSPDEALEVSTVPRMWEVLVEALKRLR